MPKEFFVDHRFSEANLQIIYHANEIIEDYSAQGFVLTLRQLYYQFVARGLFPNKQSEYARLSSIISDGRLAGLIDWEAIEDRTRNLESIPTWETPNDLLDVCAQQFRVDLWRKQPTRIEVWVEKEALTGVVEPICRKWRVPYFACRGYASQSELWRAGQRLADYHNDCDQNILVLHLGDHDPSGIDMTRDNMTRLELFTRADEDGWIDDLEIRRIALNMSQVRQYNPPPNPAKLTDARAEGYITKFGAQSWELDALSPRVIADLIDQHVRSVLDIDTWAVSSEAERKQREGLAELAQTWKADKPRFISKRKE